MTREQYQERLDSFNKMDRKGKEVFAKNLNTTPEGFVEIIERCMLDEKGAAKRDAQEAAVVAVGKKIDDLGSYKMDEISKALTCYQEFNELVVKAGLMAKALDKVTDTALFVHQLKAFLQVVKEMQLKKKQLESIKKNILPPSSYKDSLAAIEAELVKIDLAGLKHSVLLDLYSQHKLLIDDLRDMCKPEVIKLYDTIILKVDEVDTNFKLYRELAVVFGKRQYNLSDAKPAPSSTTVAAYQLAPQVPHSVLVVKKDGQADLESSSSTKINVAITSQKQPSIKVSSVFKPVPSIQAALLSSNPSGQQLKV